jgi:putative peptidoglycan lipid II flippase
MAEQERRGAGSLLVAAGILASRVAGLVREMLSAWLFGASLVTDVLAAALGGANVLQNLLGEQALSASFIPVYSRMLAAGEHERARRFAAAVLGILAVAATVIALGGILVAPLWAYVVAGGFHGRAEGSFPLLVFGLRLLFPMTAVLVLSAWCLAVLNSHRRFFLPYFAPVLWNLSLIVALLGLGLVAEGRGPRLAVAVVATGALIGAILQLALQLPAAWRLAAGGHGMVPRPSLRAPGIDEAAAAFGPALMGRGVVQLSSVVERFLASWLLTGAVAALGFAQRLYLLPLALFGTAIAVAELPELSRLQGSAAGQCEALRRLRAGFREMTFLTVPTALGFLVLGAPIVAAVYERGAFGSGDTVLVWLVLAAYALGLLPSAASRLLQNAYYAVRDTRTPAKIAAVRLVVIVAVGGGLMLPLDRQTVADLRGVEGGALALGAVGLAIGSAVAAWFELVLLVRFLSARLGARLELPWRRTPLFALVALPASALAWVLWRVIDGSVSHGIVGAVCVLLYAGLYLGLARLSGLAEARQLVGRVAALVRR